MAINGDFSRSETENNPLMRRDDSHFYASLLIAVAAHGLFAFAWAPSPSAEIYDARAVEIEIVNTPPADRVAERKVEPKVAPTQSVSPSEAPEREPEKNTSLRSDRATATAKETVHRGDPLAGRQDSHPLPSEQRSRAAIPRPTRTAPPPVSRVKELQPLLRLDPQALDETLAKADQHRDTERVVNSEPPVRKDDDRRRLERFRQSEPFSRDSLKSLFAGRAGNADFLPSIPDGDVTMLNAKADRFSVFVRRVALQVFGALRKQSWAELPRTEVRTIRTFAVVEAILSKTGKLISVQVTDQSGSRRFDSLLTAAANEGAWDQNPPSAAVAADGQIHFVFQSRTWSRISPGGPGEQRWILLGVGLL